MKIAWGRFSQKSGKQLRAGWLITAGVIAIYIGAIEPMNQVRGIATSKEAGLAASSQWEPLSMWHQTRLSTMLQKGVAGGVPGGIAGREGAAVDMAIVDALPAPPPPPIASEDRKTIRNGFMDLVVKNPRDTSDKIRQLTERAGGFLVSSETYGFKDESSAS